MGEQLWQNFDDEFTGAATADAKWEVYNTYATQLLILNGAYWEKGPRVRGCLPKFQTVRRCPHQEEQGNGASPYLLLLRAILRSLRELELAFIGLRMAVVMPALFATHNIGFFGALRLLIWFHTLFGSSLCMTCHI